MATYLWHGTYDDNVEEIIKAGYIDNIDRSETTRIINAVIYKATKRNVRANCVYLSTESECAEAYDWAFKINVGRLLASSLFVGNFHLIDRIYLLLNTLGADQREIVLLAIDYTNSLITFKEYSKFKNTKYRNWFPEVLYFDKITVSRRNLD